MEMQMPEAQQFDYASPGMSQQGQGGKLFVQFHMEATADHDLSVKEGRPVHKDEEFITIIVPGDRDSIVRPVRQQDREMYAQQYTAFKNKQEQPVTGTPLSVLPFLTRAQVADLAAVNVRTAEQLASMSDVLAQKFMGMHGLRKRVQDFLDAAAGNAPIERLNSELEKRDNTIAVLQKALDDQGKKIEELLKNRMK
jgi:predicted RNase H-like nuclease (RuvC/YqgF family)